MKMQDSTINQNQNICNASCSRGWLRLVVQCIFGFITVLSFVLILAMSVRSSRRSFLSERCLTVNCKVVCRNTPFNGNHDDAIISAVLEAEIQCSLINLELYFPMFKNRTIPRYWLSNMRTPIYELSIVGGNLEYIESEAFMSQFTGQTHTLVFKKVIVNGWKSDTFVGFSSLKSLYVKESQIKNIEPNALRPIDDSLRKLTITNSGKWKPDNITGGLHISQLATVDLSLNKFSNVLGKNSFNSLHNCQVLYLNSCEIEAIEDGTFDYLRSIKVIYLNHNFLKYIMPSLFHEVLGTALDLRVMLQHNPWHCDCSFMETYIKFNKDVFIHDPVCYHPESVRGKTFDDFKRICELNNNFRLTETVEDCDSTLTSGGCCRSQLNNSVIFITPLKKFQCPYDSIRNIDVTVFGSKPVISSKWYRPLLFIKSSKFMMIQVDSFEADDHGLIWHTSSCPNEIYCINIFPNFIKKLGINLTTEFKFCPLQLSTGQIELDECVDHYNLPDVVIPSSKKTKNIFMYILSGILCLVLGATFVYAIIFRNPSLLKGNKRVLFVKHKSVDVLVLPPKLPPRNDLLIDKLLPEFNDKNIFVIPDKKNNLCVEQFTRSTSTRSSKSNAPSYISAMQPTDDQLAEWRLNHHFDNTISITSNKSDSSLYSKEYDFDSTYFSTIESCDLIYETLK